MLTQETTMYPSAVIREKLHNYTRDVGLLPESTMLQMRALVDILAHASGLGPEWAARLDLSLIDAMEIIDGLNDGETL